MIQSVTVRRAGGSLTIVLPKAQAERLNIKKGDALWIAETPDGLLLTAEKHQFNTLMEMLREGGSEYRQAVAALGR